MTATIDTPAALKAMEFYGRLLRLYGPDGAPNMSWPQMMAIYQQGKGAMYIDASGHYPQLLDASKSSLASKTGIAVFPAGPVANRPYMAPQMAVAIYSGSRNKDNAWKFIRFVTDKPRTAYVQGEFGYMGARISAMKDPAGLKNFPKDLAEAAAIESAYAMPYERPVITAVQEARDAIGEAVVASIMGGDYQAAAKKANATLQALLDREK